MGTCGLRGGNSKGKAAVYDYLRSVSQEGSRDAGWKTDGVNGGKLGHKNLAMVNGAERLWPYRAGEKRDCEYETRVLVRGEDRGPRLARSNRLPCRGVRGGRSGTGKQCCRAGGAKVNDKTEGRLGFTCYR